MYRVALSALAAILPLQAAYAQSPEWSDPSHRVRMVSVEPQVRLEVLDWGGAGEPMVFLTGLGDSAHSYDDFAPRFRDAYHVYAVTRRGFGASSQPEGGYDAATRARDIRIVLDSLGIESAILVGHSIAGDELSTFAVAYPERVRALVYLDAYDYGRGFADLVSSLPAPTPLPMRSEDSASVAGFRVHLAREYGIALPEAEIRAIYRFDASGKWQGPVTPDAVPTKVLQGAEPSEYARIAAPALAIYAPWTSVEEGFAAYASYDAEGRARADRYFDAITPLLGAVMERFRSETPKGRVLVLPGAHHYVHYSHADTVERAMRDFLAREAAPARR